MAVLATIRPEYVGPFSERIIAGYAHENIASFRWDETAAVARAQDSSANCCHEAPTRRSITSAKS